MILTSLAPGMVTYTDMDITIVPPGHRVPAVAVIPWNTGIIVNEFNGMYIHQ